MSRCERPRTFLVSLTAALACAALAGGAELEVGKPFPGMTLPALEDGAPRSIADFAGRKLVLHVWASW